MIAQCFDKYLMEVAFRVGFNDPFSNSFQLSLNLMSLPIHAYSDP